MYQIPTLPLKQDVETKAVLKQAAKAHRRLAELKGAVLSCFTCFIINTLKFYDLILERISDDNKYIFSLAENTTNPSLASTRKSPFI